MGTEHTPTTTGRRFLVTGAYGCIGAWTVRRLLDSNESVVTFDTGSSDHRLRLLLDDEELNQLTRIAGDVTDLEQLEAVIDRHAVTNVIHLAALQVPLCRENPPLGASVNVVGTVNVLEAVRRRAEHMAHVVYASSVAVYDEGERATQAAAPGTLYGSFKRANEGAAAVYFSDFETSSIGLRPHTVYGPGRDQGLTSAPTVAILAAVSGKPYHIEFGGRCQMQYAEDVADAFIRASMMPYHGASVHNLPGPVVTIDEIVDAITTVVPAASALITAGSSPLPFPAEVEFDSFLDLVGAAYVSRSLHDGVAASVQRFEALLAADRVEAPASR